jgi:hypothetical protein
MNDIDEEIKKALSKADHKALDEIGKEAGLFEVIGLSFSGRQAWLTYTLYALGFATFIAGVWMSTKFFTSAGIKTSLAWLLGIIVCLFGFAIVNGYQLATNAKPGNTTRDKTLRNAHYAGVRPT